MASTDSQLPSHSPALVSSVGLALYAFAALGADALMDRLVRLSAETFQFMPAAVANAVVPFFIITSGLAFGWLVLIRLPRNLPAAAIVLAAGLTLVMIYLPFVSIPLWLRHGPVGWLRQIAWGSGGRYGYPASYYMACSCVVIGLVALLRRPGSSLPSVADN